jgi:cell division septum initiation protein DivIVA
MIRLGLLLEQENMSGSNDEVESLLCVACVAEADRYERAIRIARNLKVVLQEDQSCEDAIEQLQAILDEVAQIETQVVEPKRIWQAGGRKTGPALSVALERMTTALRQLAGEIQGAEQSARTQMKTLAAHLDTSIKGCRMLRAYTQSMTAAE